MELDLPKPLLDYYRRIGAEPVNHYRATVKIYYGTYYREKATIRITEDFKIKAPKDYAPDDEEEKAIVAALKAHGSFPKAIGATLASVEALEPLTTGQLVLFWNRASDTISFVQERVQLTKAKKIFIPWTFTDTAGWLKMEPDKLPFFKPRKGDQNSAIMLHEGAKAATAAQAIADDPNSDHPWALELRPYEHWGLIGGALAPHRADWQELRNINPGSLTYVCDRDQPGEAALQLVSRLWDSPLTGIKFGADFEERWDIADPLPKKMFSSKSKRFIGQPLASYKVSATWATEKVQSENAGRPRYVIKQEFASEWFHSVQPEIFIHKDNPYSVLNAREFNNMVRPYSDVDDTARLLMTSGTSKSFKLQYDPARSAGTYTSPLGESYINAHCPSSVVAEPGDPQPWLDYISYLLPNEKDRIETMRWIATLACHPEIKMHYALLLISTRHGVGKSFLATNVLCPLVGVRNYAAPSQQEIVDNKYNDWAANIRLAACHEIYAGHSSKAYDALKDIITEKDLNITKKYVNSYKIRNWVHLYACSNSPRALKLAVGDRRWLIPKVTNDHRPYSYWDELAKWLNEEGGLGIVRWWLEEFLKREDIDPVYPGQEAPMTSAKMEVLDENKSRGQQIVSRHLEFIKDKLKQNEPAFVMDQALVELIKMKEYEGRHNDKLERPSTIRQTAESCGWFIGNKPARIKDWGEVNWRGRVIATTPELAAMEPGDIQLMGLKPINVMEVMF